MVEDVGQREAGGDGGDPGGGIAGWPAPAGAPVLLFGGSFDPVHPAHVALAQGVRDALFGARGHAVFVPAARSPHKGRGPVASAADRVRMLEIALRGDERAHVWTDEIDRAESGEPSYWVQTIRRARRVAPDAQLRFLIGADQAVAFGRWREPGAIVELAEPAVVLREPVGTRERLARALRDAGLDDASVDWWLARVVRSGLFEASSTGARRRLERGEAAGLDAGVEAYILAHGLYAERSS